jgi:hypothetical protein
MFRTWPTVFRKEWTHVFIKHLTGARAGEIEDVIYEAAKAKVLAGEAEDVYDQLLLKRSVEAPVSQPEIVSERADKVTVQVTRNFKRR